MNIIIVGAGIVGLSIARATLDRAAPCHAARAGRHPQSRRRLVRRAPADPLPVRRCGRLRAHGGRCLASLASAVEQIGASHFADSGVISISLRPGDYADTSLATLRRAGLPHEELGGARRSASCRSSICRRTQRRPLPSGRRTVRRPHRARSRGAGPRKAPRWCRIARRGRRRAAASVRTQRGETIAGDLVIVAAGAWLDTAAAASTRHCPHSARRSATSSRRHAQAAWDGGPALCVIGDNNVYTLPPRDGTGLKFGCGALRQTAGPEQGGSCRISRAAD